MTLTEHISQSVIDSRLYLNNTYMKLQYVGEVWRWFDYLQALLCSFKNMAFSYSYGVLVWQGVPVLVVTKNNDKLKNNLKSNRIGT